MASSKIEIQDNGLKDSLDRFLKLEGPKAFSKILNKAMFFAMVDARKRTMKFTADKSSIRSVYGRRLTARSRIKNRRKGQRQNPYAILSASLRRGENKKYSKFLDNDDDSIGRFEVAKKFVTRKYIAIGFRTLGFTKGLKALSRGAGTKWRGGREPGPKNQESRAFIAKPNARQGFKRREAVFFYRLRDRWGREKNSVSNHTQRAMVSAIRDEGRNLERKIAKKEVEHAMRKAGFRGR